MLHFCLLPDFSTCKSAESLWGVALPCAFHGTSRTVINVDEWAGRPSLFQPWLNRKFPLSLTMYSLYQSDRVEASYTPLPSPCPYPPPSVCSKEEGKPEEAAKITAHKPTKSISLEVFGLIRQSHKDSITCVHFAKISTVKEIIQEMMEVATERGGSFSVPETKWQEEGGSEAEFGVASAVDLKASWPLENRVVLFLCCWGKNANSTA